MPPPRPGPRGGPQERRIPVAIPPRARPHSVSHPRGWANAGLQRIPSSVTGVYAPGRPRLARRRRSRSVDWVSDVDGTVFPGAIPGDAPHPSATGTGRRGSASGDRIVPGNLRPMGTGPRRPPIPFGAWDQPARSDHRVVCMLPTPAQTGDPPRQPARPGPRRRSCGLPGPQAPTPPDRLTGAANIPLPGPPGVGRTHLAIALARRAIEKGQGACFPLRPPPAMEDLGRVAAGAAARAGSPVATAGPGCIARRRRSCPGRNDAPVEGHWG